MLSFVTMFAAVSRCARLRIQFLRETTLRGRGDLGLCNVAIPASVASSLLDPPRPLSNRHDCDGVHREFLALSGQYDVIQSILQTFIRLLSPLAGYSTTLRQVPSDPTLDKIRNNRTTSSIDPANGKLTRPTAHLVPRFAGDAESAHVLDPHTSGLQSRLCAWSLGEISSGNASIAWYNGHGSGCSPTGEFYTDINLIAHWANLRRVEEAATRNHIIQSLISHSKLHDHQADALVILFKLAGATFEAYADPSVVNCCFELIKGHYSRSSVRGGLVQVRTLPSGSLRPPG